MKKILLTLAVALLFGGLANCALAAEKIDDYDVDIVIRPDSVIEVTEKISYDFGDDYRHGIFRNIPLGDYFSEYRLNINRISVQDENGNDINFSTARGGNELSIKIGDPNKTITGQHIYQISYQVDNGLRFFDDHVELYWNAIGDQWPVSIGDVNVVVHLPSTIDRGLTNYDCFQDERGSKNSCRGIALPSDTTSTLVFSFSDLAPQTGGTVVVGMPLGYIVQPVGHNLLNLFFTLFPICLPFLSLMMMFILWWKYGRDPRGKGTIVTQFGPPENMMPAEMGIVMTEYVTPKHLSAEIINLAVHGYLKIINNGKKWWQGKSSAYTLVRLKNDDGLEYYQTLVFRLLFEDENSGLNTEIKLSEISSRSNGAALLQSKAETIKKIKEELYKSVTEKGYFVSNPTKRRMGYYIVGGIMMFLSACIGISIDIDSNVLLSATWTISLFGSGVIFLVGSYLMPAKTQSGSETVEYILGFKNYLKVAEKDRLNFHNAPSVKPETFDAFLPYAMVLGVEKAWAKQFESIYQTPPNWYSDTTGAAFNSSMLVSNLGTFNTQSMGLFSTSSSGGSGFGGGGFSGGGGGGGGGGSW